MSYRRIVLLALLLAQVAPVGGATAQSTAEPPVDLGPESGPDLFLSGPFGRIAGGSVEEPASAQPGNVPLDTFVRSAPLELDADGAALLPEGLSVRSTDLSGVVEILSSGSLMFEGPSLSGQHLVVTETVTDDGTISQRAWLIDVPDRDPPADGLYDIPAPDVLLVGATGDAMGTPGDGCYLYLCAEVGFPTPPEFLETLAVMPGESLAARLSDGSAITSFEGTLEPLGDTQGERQQSEGVFHDEAVSSVLLAGLDGPTEGDWLLTLKVVFDRERGWIESSYRLKSERRPD